MTELNKEYAQALFALARETGRENAYAEQLGAVLSALEELPEYVEFLTAPSIPKGERLAALEAAFGQSTDEYVLSFLQLLCDKGRIATLGACLAEYRLLLDEFNRVSVATVRSGVPLTDRERSLLKNKLEQMSCHRVELVCSHDPSLLGGLVVEMDGKCIDGSLRRRLHEVKDVISK